MSPHQVIAVGVRLFAIWLFIRIGLFMPVSFWQAGYFDNHDDVGIRMFRYAIQLAFGVWLLLGAKGFRKLIWWARNAGRPQPR